MNTLLKKLNIWEYDRISITTDYKSECVSNILYNKIKDVMNDEIPKRMGLMKPGSKINFFDEVNEVYKYLNKKDYADYVMKQIKDGDAFLYRGIYWKSVVSGFNGIPQKMVYMSELIFTIIENKLTVIKDRYRDPSDIQDVDLKPFLVSSKITKILNNINGK